MVLTARWLLERDGSLDREQLRAGLAGNLCRCTGYTKILDAVVDYARGSVPHGD
jgi:carbon-monoxide dehydrogenase small subunit